MSLDRFKTAQASADAGFAQALAELESGAKRSHWIWYIFPQLVGLGHSPNARWYGVRGRDEAVAYLRDPELFARLQAVTEAVGRQLGDEVSLVTLMGGTTDALKLVSSLTLFERIARAEDKDHFAQRCAEILSLAERQGYARCTFTLAELRD